MLILKNTYNDFKGVTRHMKLWVSGNIILFFWKNIANGYPPPQVNDSTHLPFGCRPEFSDEKTLHTVFNLGGVVTYSLIRSDR